MTNFENFKERVLKYLTTNHVSIEIESTLRKTSYNDKENKYLYDGCDMQVISMDSIAREGYKIIKKAECHPLNSVDAFLVSESGCWYFIEFKDCKINNKKDNIEKKGMANLFMLMDINEELNNELIDGYDSFLKFARDNIEYILVFSKEKDFYAYDQVRAHDNLNEKYTPECLKKFKYFFFKDAYAYSEEYFERRFVSNFKY